MNYGKDSKASKRKHSDNTRTGTTMHKQVAKKVQQKEQRNKTAKYK